MKVIVVGGGIVGAACAYQLARRGATVELLDAGDPPSGASARSDGGLLVGNKRPADVPLVREALAAWQRLGPLLDGVEYEDNQLLMVGQDETQEQSLRERAAALRDAGVEVHELTGAECRHSEPGLGSSVTYGITMPDNRALQPMLATVALLGAARAAGVTVRPHTSVDAVEPGRVWTQEGVETADEVLVAAGAWTGELLAPAGIELPIEPRRGHVLVVERRASAYVRRGAMGSAYADVAHSSDPDLRVVPLATTTRSGTVLVGASRERVGFDERPNPSAVARISGAVTALYPALASCRVIRSWVGFRPWSADGYPYAGRLAPGLAVAAGHEGEGITYGPLTGELLAAHLLDGEPVPATWDASRVSATNGVGVTPSPTPGGALDD